MSLDVEDLESLASIERAITRIANAVTAPASPGTDVFGGSVSSLTEALMGVTTGLDAIAVAIDGLALAVGDKESTS